MFSDCKHPVPSADLLQATEIVAKRVNNIYYDAPDCLEPLSATPQLSSETGPAAAKSRGKRARSPQTLDLFGEDL